MTGSVLYFPEQGPGSVPDPQMAALASRAADLMERNPGRPLTLTELADALGVDRFRLHRAFVRCFGVPPHRYDLARRVRLAADMLSHGARVSVAARATGFHTLTYFSRRFRAVFGVSPSDFKREARRRAARAS
jgi:AraC-like DNA-binding protein